MLKKIKIKDLKLAEYNPRETDKSMLDKLKNSIKEFGYIEPIIYNEKNGNIIGGHSRYIVLKEMYGEDYEAEVISLSLDDKREKTLNIALNKIKGDWDEEKLNKILLGMNIDYVKLSGFDKRDHFKNESEMNLSEVNTVKNIEEEMQLTFWFDNEEDRNIVESFFRNNKNGWDQKGPNVNLLKKVIDGYKIKNVK
jgi:ParB-like chromosome segregation protein Spo0J